MRRGGVGRGWCLAGCKTNLRPFPRGGGGGGTLRSASSCEERTVVVASPQVGGLGVRDFRNGRPGQAATSRRKVCERGADTRSWSTEEATDGKAVRKVRL